MAAPCSSEFSSEASSCLKIPKTEVLSPESPGLSDGNRSVSDLSTPGHSSPLQMSGSGGVSATGVLGGVSAAEVLGAASSPSVSFTACRGMSWTPAETNALIAVWGNERLVEARYQQLEGAGTVFGIRSPGPAMYERVSRALAELGYERTPSQCRERMKLVIHCCLRHRISSKINATS
ncbi:myb/SANT-like DNA-binding domain-containing protein 2 isoform X2 [Microcaecilia unicolor]|uniref:Myb/SANT-like DNA-binding domain-containing protein 2 isoform X2 n=1 Tax=Microcaecilia unicolor TaxID=1415580 RepID=A0A6P7ZHP9_9AMPH|nr:myb/SANT-like DNA-binding domain-containing protein 2 isoform X2 [Microcaecilia unicolor]XP_030077279.1 myb/SANT-like DNA-binding domain-containing protein 2 isoform X2 [Microcaecilia unicolor]